MTQKMLIPFTGAALDAREHHRTLDDLKTYLDDPKTRALLLHKGQPSLTPDMRLMTVHPSALIGANLFDPGPLFLGIDEHGPVFAFSLGEPLNITEPETFQDLRAVAGRMDGRELALTGLARSLFDWHFNHTYCAKCGQVSQAVDGGIKRHCKGCEAEHFPRVNPVVIMLVTCGDEVLLGRGPEWPDGFYSALAGFVSPGENLEEACRREVFEEVGLHVHSPRYIMSQPWPFPSQLMVGMTCSTDDKDLVIDTNEIQDAQWFTRTQVEAVFNKTGDAFMRPPRFTIAHHLLRDWLKP